MNQRRRVAAQERSARGGNSSFSNEEEESAPRSNQVIGGAIPVPATSAFMGDPSRMSAHWPSAERNDS